MVCLMVAEVDLNERSVPSLEIGDLNLLSFLYLNINSNISINFLF